MGDLEEMTDDKLDQEIQQRLAERERRKALAEAPAQADALVERYQAALGREGGSEWERPDGLLSTYPLGAVHTHAGHMWESLRSANPDEPGVASWRIVPEVDPETGKEIPPPYVQPSGAHDAHPLRWRITWEDGLVYETTREAVAHTPAEAPEQWQLVQEEAAADPDEPEPDQEPTDPDQPEVPAWEPGQVFDVGDKLTFDGITYVVLQEHTSAAHWPPDQVASLYEPTSEDDQR